jgi:two-component system C4-dicarboxylate transport sensor histidine kinase DctB
MDYAGTTIVASNRNTPGNFIGKNYAFRPYFQKAIQGHPATYMASGVTSNKQGRYENRIFSTKTHFLPPLVLS